MSQFEFRLRWEAVVEKLNAKMSPLGRSGMSGCGAISKEADVLPPTIADIWPFTSAADNLPSSVGSNLKKTQFFVSQGAKADYDVIFSIWDAQFARCMTWRRMAEFHESL